MECTNRESTVSGESIELPDRKTPVDVIDLDGEGIVVTSKDGGLALYRLNSNKGMTACSNVGRKMVW